MRIRIARQGIHDNTIATSAREADLALRVPWVEIDGIRYSGDCVRASIESTAKGVERVTLEFLAIGSTVLVDEKGEPLP